MPPCYPFDEPACLPQKPRLRATASPAEDSEGSNLSIQFANALLTQRGNENVMPQRSQSLQEAGVLVPLDLRGAQCGRCCGVSGSENVIRGVTGVCSGWRSEHGNDFERSERRRRLGVRKAGSEPIWSSRLETRKGKQLKSRLEKREEKRVLGRREHSER